MQNLNALPNIPDLPEIISIPEKREALKSRGKGTSEMQLNKVIALSKMDQEILQNYKLRVQTLESELKNKKDEQLSISRNFDALCLKSKEDSHLIKKLEEELNFLKLKDKNQVRMSSSNIPKFDDENQVLMKSYKEKIDYQTTLIKELETKISTNTSRFNERDKFYKNYTKTLEDKTQNQTKTIETLEKEKIGIKKEFDKLLKETEKIKNELGNTSEENQSLTNKNKDLSEVLEALNSKHEKILEMKDNQLKNKLKAMNEDKRKIQNTINSEEKLKNENEIFNKLIEEVKLRNKTLEENLNNAEKEIKKKHQEFNIFKQTAKQELIQLLDSQEKQFKNNINALNNRLLVLNSKCNKLGNNVTKSLEQLITSKNLAQSKHTNALHLHSLELKKHKESLNNNDITQEKILELESIISINNKKLQELSTLNTSLEEKSLLIPKLELKLKDYEGLENDVKLFTRYNEEFKRKINKLEDIIRLKDQDISEYSINVKEISDNEKKIKAQNESYRTMLAAAEDKIKNFDNLRLEGELKLNSNISSLENVIEHQRSDYETLKKEYEYLKSKGSGVEKVKEFYQQLISTNSKVILII